DSCASCSKRTASLRGMTSVGWAVRTGSAMAHGASRIARNLRRLEAHVDGIPEMQLADVVADAEQQFQRRERLQAADHADRRTEHPCLLARLRDVALLRIQASVTGTVAAPRVEHRELAFEPDRRAGDERLARAHAALVRVEARGEIVGAVEHDVDARDRIAPRLFLAQLELHLAIERAQAIGSGVGLGAADIALCIEDLTLQIGQIDDVAIGDDEPADAGGREVLRSRAAEAAEPEHEDRRVAQHALSGDADFAQHDLSRVSRQVAHSRPPTQPPVTRGTSPRSPIVLALANPQSASTLRTASACPAPCSSSNQPSERRCRGASLAIARIASSPSGPEISAASGS